MTTDTTQRFWSGIDVAKLVAGSLAAVSAAVCASFLGVTGTLIGAAVASLVGTVGQELYAQSLQRGYDRLRAQRRTRIAPDPADTRAPSTPRSSVRPPGAKRPLWQRIAVASVAAFALAMLAISAVELLSGRALAGMLGDDSAGASTISSVVDGDDGAVVTPQPSSTPDRAPEPTAEPSATAEGTEPAPVQPTTAEPSAAPTAEPTAPQPAPTGGASTGPGPR